MNRQEYLASLPKKIMGAGCLFFDSDGKILIVKPTYRDTWNLPGGVVEANESPRNACIREVYEEIGIEVKLERLLCIDYTSKNETAIESLQFIFFGGPIKYDKLGQSFLYMGLTRHSLKCGQEKSRFFIY